MQRRFSTATIVFLALIALSGCATDRTKQAIEVGQDEFLGCLTIYQMPGRGVRYLGSRDGFVYLELHSANDTSLPAWYERTIRTRDGSAVQDAIKRSRLELDTRSRQRAGRQDSGEVLSTRRGDDVDQ